MRFLPSAQAAFLRSFRHRDYRLFYSGQLVSLLGTWLQSTVLGWVVYDITKSPAKLGLVGFASQLPPLLFGVVAGVFADRWDKRRALVWTQALSMMQAFALGLLTLSGAIQVWQIMALGFLLGIVNAFDMPIRQSFVVEIVGRRDLANALALNSVMFNIARTLGPAAAGFLLAYVGAGNCFLLNAASYLFVIWALLKIDFKPAPPAEKHDSVLASLKEGLGYVRNTAFIRNPLLLLAGVSFVVIPLMTQLPAAAVELLRGGPKTLGFLISCIGLGAIFGAAHLAARNSPKGLGALIASSSIVYGAAIAAFSVSSRIEISCLLLVVAGAGMMRQGVACNTLIQTLVQNNMRGRVTGLYAITFFGLAPLGSLLLGWLAAAFGVRTAYAFGGVWVLGMTAWFVYAIPDMKKSAAFMAARHADVNLGESLESLESII